MTYLAWWGHQNPQRYCCRTSCRTWPLRGFSLCSWQIPTECWRLFFAGENLPTYSIPLVVLGCHIMVPQVWVPSTAVSASKTSPSQSPSPIVSNRSHCWWGMHPDWSHFGLWQQDERWLLFCNCRVLVRVDAILTPQQGVQFLCRCCWVGIYPSPGCVELRKIWEKLNATCNSGCVFVLFQNQKCPGIDLHKPRRPYPILTTFSWMG